MCQDTLEGLRNGKKICHKAYVGKDAVSRGEVAGLGLPDGYRPIKTRINPLLQQNSNTEIL